MKSHKIVEVSEEILEDLILRDPDSIEKGLTYIDSKRMTDRGHLLVLFVDRRKSLVVTALKTVEDDSVLVQGLGCYDYFSERIQALVRNYKKNHDIDPTQPIRLFLICPRFSRKLINRCQWINIPVSLFSFMCIQLENDKSIQPIFVKEKIFGAAQMA